MNAINNTWAVVRESEEVIDNTVEEIVDDITDADRGIYLAFYGTAVVRDGTY